MGFPVSAGWPPLGSPFQKPTKYFYYSNIYVVKSSAFMQQKIAYLSTSSCKQTTDLRSSPSPTEKLHNMGKSSTVLWIKNRWYEDTGGNNSTL